MERIKQVKLKAGDSSGQKKKNDRKRGRQRDYKVEKI